jgi:hypothetical protein
MGQKTALRFVTSIQLSHGLRLSDYRGLTTKAESRSVLSVLITLERISAKR